MELKKFSIIQILIKIVDFSAANILFTEFTGFYYQRGVWEKKLLLVKLNVVQIG